MKERLCLIQCGSDPRSDKELCLRRHQRLASSHTSYLNDELMRRTALMFNNQIWRSKGYTLLLYQTLERPVCYVNEARAAFSVALCFFFPHSLAVILLPSKRNGIKELD